MDLTKIQLKDVIKLGDVKIIDVFLKTANLIADKLKTYNDQYNFCYNAIREHRQNIEKYTKEGSVGFFVYQEDFFDRVNIFPQLNSDSEIWSRRTNIGGSNYISVYFYQLSAWKSHALLQNVFANTPQSIKGVSYGKDSWKQNTIDAAYYNCDRYGYYGKNWKALGRERVDVDNYGAHYRYYTILGFGYSFEKLRQQIPEDKCEIY